MTTTPRPAGPIPTPTKTPSRRSTLVRKRDEMENGSSPAPAKRAKVTFDERVEVQDVHDWEKAPEVILEEVHRTLQRHAHGEESGYDGLKNIYQTGKKDTKSVSSVAIRSYTAALLSNISFLNKSCSDLVHAVLNSQWLGREDDYVKVYLRLVANIVSSQGLFLGEVLGMLVENLTAEPPSSGEIPDQPRVTRLQIHSRTHSALRYLLRLIPSASHTLAASLANQFPHETDTLKSHTIYIQNLLRVITYAPELRGDVLSLILDRLVKIDVRVQVDYEDLQIDVREAVDQQIARTTDDKTNDAQLSDFSDNDENPTADLEDTIDSEAKEVLENADKVDAILDLLFRHYDGDFRSTSDTVRNGALDTLLTHFMTIILPTQRSRHTQFLVFHFAQTSPAFVDTFVGTCVNTVFEKNQPALIRQAGAAYLASFVARGMHVPSNIVRDVFDYIGVELTRLRGLYEPNCNGPNLRRYSSYYCLVQALLYIFCFRWRDLEYSYDEDSEDEGLPFPYRADHQWMPGVKETLTQNIFSTKLNPLKVCQPDLVEQFAEIANQLRMIYVFGLIETNKRINLSGLTTMSAYGHPSRETALSARKDEEHHVLDAYFPFDPITLPKSRKWVEGDCREWMGLPGADGDEESESEVDEAPDSEVEEDTATDESNDSF